MECIVDCPNAPEIIAGRNTRESRERTWIKGGKEGKEGVSKNLDL